MFPTLGHVINYIFGTHILLPLPTYGFILVLAFLVGGLLFKTELQKKEKKGLLKPHIEKVIVSAPINYIEITITCLFYFVFAYKIGGAISDYSTFSSDIDKYIFSTEGNIIIGLIAFIISFILIFINLKKTETPEIIYKEVEVFPHEQAINLVMVAMISGIIGAKIFDILENFKLFLNDPLDQIFSSGGFTFYGGLIVAGISVIYFAKRKQINIYHLLDCAAPVILIGYAVGRMACMASGDGCWGINNNMPKPEFLNFLPNWMWAYNFPHNVIHEGVTIVGCTEKYCSVLSTPVFPTSFYESILSAIFCVCILLLKNKIKTPGNLFFLMLIMNGVARFFIEKIRINNLYHIGNIKTTQAEIISSLLVIFGITGMIILKKLYKQGRIKT